MVVERYGKSEANVAVNIVHRKLRAKERNNWDIQTTHREIAEAIIGHPKTPESTADIQRYLDATATHEAQTIQTQQQNSGLTAKNVSTSSEGNRIFLINDNTGKNSAYNCRVAAKADSYSDKIRAVSNASTFGSGNAWGRLSGISYTGSSPAIFDVTCDYDIQAYERNSSCKVSLFVREEGGGPRFKTVDKINSYVDATRSRTARFEVDPDEKYYVGVELYTQSAAGGDPATISDVYNDTLNNGRRHFKVNELTLEEEPR